MALKSCSLLKQVLAPYKSVKNEFCIVKKLFVGNPAPLSRCASTGGQLLDIVVDDKTGIATVAMKRPPVNSLNLELLEQITNALQTIEDNKSSGMILTSSSSSVFSAGLDIMEMYKPNQDRLKKFWTTLQDMWLKLYSTPYPTVAAINGHSPAGGCLLALSCEYRIMVGPKFTIGLNETLLGMVAPRWFQDSMRNVLSRRDAELALTMGKMFSTEEALKVGLIDSVAKDKDDAITQANDFLAKTKKIPRVARNLTKQACRNEAIEWLHQNKDLDLQIFLTFINQPVMQKGLELYLESLKKK